MADRAPLLRGAMVPLADPVASSTSVNVHDSDQGPAALWAAPQDRPASSSTPAILLSLQLVRAVTWMFMGGFGAPWVLFAIFSTIATTFFSDSNGNEPPILSSSAYFYTSVLGSIAVAVGRTATILKITLDREAQARSGDGAVLEPISHRHYWWCNRMGLAVSCLFVLGDGIGRVFVPATALNFVSLMYWLPEGGLYALEGFFYTILTLSFLSGAYRVAWWIWYWFTFGEIDEEERAKLDDDDADAYAYAAAAPAWENAMDEGGKGPRDATESHGASEPRLRSALRAVYPSISRMVRGSWRTSIKLGYSFCGGFGCVWAVFSVANAIALQQNNDLFQSEVYLWVALSISIVGGLYGGLYGGDKRFKVFLH